MSGETIETIYGKRSKYEIKRRSGFTGPSFSIYKDGKRWRGDYSSLERAVDVAKSAG